MTELPKAYQPQDHESMVAEEWLASGFFNPDKLPGNRRRPFVISMPPPNITGSLHLGHALGMTIQDILIRYHRMRGEKALWIPGTDHAAIATQMVVDRELQKEGVDRFTLGREKFLQRVWKWKEQYGKTIVDQIQSLGASADWSRERFTMDEGLTTAVNRAFKKLYDDGLIYRGERIVNWCPVCGTAISDIEVDHENVPGKLWFITYAGEPGTSITVATTRPETMLGDTAIAVHPKDERYAALIGTMVTVPLVGRSIPIIADERIERDFGTGAVKVTPGHDPLDFDLGQDHKLARIDVIGQDGLMTAAAGSAYAGQTVEEARKNILEDLRGGGFLDHEEDYVHAVGFCSRSKNPIEPLVSLQWFLNTKPLAKKAIAAVRSGKIRIHPARFEKTYFQWMEHIRDWNISRQIWWGHRLPVWTKTNNVGKVQTKVSPTSPGEGWTQDEDTLDTWFSSGLWTFSTLGWPYNTKDLKTFHPTSVMVTGWDILFFWVARMIMFSEYFLKEVPFRDVYITGLILDEEGKKMSKSKGTGLDPLVMTKKYGTDALRLSLVIGNAAGQDFKYSEQRTEQYRNFVNKLWNVARFVLSHERPTGKALPVTLADEWILDRLGTVVEVVTKHLDGLDFSSAGSALYDFVWHDFADWYLEAKKVRPNPGVLYLVLETILPVLHPFAPFVTETLWSALGYKNLLVQPWPKADRKWKHPRSAKEFTRLQTVVVAVRNFHSHTRAAGQLKGKYVDSHEPQLDAKLVSALTSTQVTLEDRLDVVSGYANITLGDIEFQFPEAAVKAYESWRQKERTSLEAYIAAIKKKLDNESFVAHAPAGIVDQERTKLAEAEQRLMEL